MANQKKIIHIDMDCFYAAVEMRDDPSLRNKPIAVGGAADRRGVLCTCNYAARKFGVRSAMATAHALKLCPQLTIVPVNFDKYRAASTLIQTIFHQFTDLIEPLSLDEAYLDVSDCEQFQGSGTLIAQAIKQRIFSTTQLTASAGVAPNKFLAKIASDWKKPDGLFVITPNQVDDFIRDLPIDKLFGVGKVTAKKLHDMQIYHCSDLQTTPIDLLTQKLGKFGARLIELANGIDSRTVQPNRMRKSLSVERTFDKDLNDIEAGKVFIQSLFDELNQRLEKHSQRDIKNLFVKLKFFDFQQTTVECLANKPQLELFYNLMAEGYQRRAKPIRLLGIGVRFHELDQKNDAQQLEIELL